MCYEVLGTVEVKLHQYSIENYLTIFNLPNCHLDALQYYGFT